MDLLDVFKQARPVSALLLLTDLLGNLRNVDARDAFRDLVQHLLLVQREVDRRDLASVPRLIRYLCARPVETMRIGTRTVFCMELTFARMSLSAATCDRLNMTSSASCGQRQVLVSAPMPGRGVLSIFVRKHLHAGVLRQVRVGHHGIPS